MLYSTRGTVVKKKMHWKRKLSGCSDLLTSLYHLERWQDGAGTAIFCELLNACGKVQFGRGESCCMEQEAGTAILSENSGNSISSIADKANFYILQAAGSAVSAL